MIPDMQKYKQSLLFAFFIISFSSEEHQTVYVQVEIEEPTDDGSSWENVSDHFLFTPSL